MSSASAARSDSTSPAYTSAVTRTLEPVSEREPTELSTETLRCIECTAETADGDGWRAFITADDEVATYCSECATREFGGP
jgi:hypothetical protein